MCQSFRYSLAGQIDDDDSVSEIIIHKKETPTKGCLCNMYTVTRRFSAASSASARCSQNIEAAMPPDPNEESGRYSPERGCHEVTGVEIIAKKKPGGEPGVFFACYKRNKFIC